MNKNIIILFMILILIVIGIAFAVNTTTTANHGGSNVTLQIQSNSSWTGNYAYHDGNLMINGTGNAVYNLGSNPGHVTVTLTNTGTGTLTVQLLQGGNIVESQSTQESQGIINLDNKF